MFYRFQLDQVCLLCCLNFLFLLVIFLFATKRLTVALGQAPLKSRTEKCSWTQVVYMNENPRHFNKEMEKVRQNGEKSQDRACY